MRYMVRYGSDSQRTSEIDSDSRDARKHGRALLGSAGGGWVDVFDRRGRPVSAARYTPEGDRWYNWYFQPYGWEGK